MEEQQAPPSYVASSSFPTVPTSYLKPLQTSHNATMDMDTAMTEDDRTQRAASVLSGMSMEDMEAAETLKSLGANFRPCSQAQHTSPPPHLQTTSTYDSSSQPEPLLSLLTSQHPLAGALINGSLSAYRVGQAFFPGAYFVEQNVGLPIAGTMARVTGVEGGIRRVLQSRRDGSYQAHGQNPPGDTGLRMDNATNTTSIVDIEKALTNGAQTRRAPEISFADQLPVYDEGGRSPPYQVQQLDYQSRQGHASPGWRTQLMISTSGLGVAMSEESLKRLRYCLSWLRWANNRLGDAISSLTDVLRAWNEGNKEARPQNDSGLTRTQQNRSQAALTARIAALKTDVLQTLKQVVDVVSNYAGGALPDNARNLVHRHLTSLPQRFSIASAMSSSNENRDEAASSGHRVLVLAQEGLSMMNQVTEVVNDTLVSAESWCERLNRRRGQDQHGESLIITADGSQLDTKMEMS